MKQLKDRIKDVLRLSNQKEIVPFEKEIANYTYDTPVSTPIVHKTNRLFQHNI